MTAPNGPVRREDPAYQDQGALDQPQQEVEEPEETEEQARLRLNATLEERR